jgi:hypothetical protein
MCECEDGGQCCASWSYEVGVKMNPFRVVQLRLIDSPVSPSLPIVIALLPADKYFWERYVHHDFISFTYKHLAIRNASPLYQSTISTLNLLTRSMVKNLDEGLDDSDCEGLTIVLTPRAGLLAVRRWI